MLLLDTDSLAGWPFHGRCRAWEFQVKIISVCLFSTCLLFEVSNFCHSGACQFRTTEQWLLLCLNFVVQGRLMESQ